ncbi:MAG: hypothetical protein K2H46_12425 [Muribaculaceae bacterium]|nr:hypothetical protein [Muribaculaceae bacterium]
MDWWITNILNKGLRSELKDNKLASQLYSLEQAGELDNPNREAIVSKFLNPNSSYSLEEEVQEIDAIVDKRLLHLAIKNLKKYPGKIYGEECKGDVFFGIPFSLDQRPKSVVYLGSNGSGKTSLYSALEFMGMKKSNTAFIRGYRRFVGETSVTNILGRDQEKDQREYLRHTNKDGAEPEIILARKDRILECLDIVEYTEKKESIPDAFYCSDYDVRELEACKNYTSFLIDQLGLRRCYDALQFLYFSQGYVVRERMKFENWRNSNIEKDKGELELQKDIELFLLGLTIEKCDDVEHIKEVVGRPIELDALNDVGVGTLSQSQKILIDLRSFLRSEQRNFSNNSWFSFNIWNSYNQCIVAIRNLYIHLINTRGKAEKSLLDSLKAKVSSLKALRIQLSERLEAYATDATGWDDMQYIRACEKRLNSLSNTKSKIASYKPIEARYIKEAYDSPSFERFENEIKQLISFVETELERLLTEWKARICDFFKEILSDYFDIDNDEVWIYMDFVSVNLSHLVDIEDANFLKRPILHDFIKFDIKIKSSGGNYDPQVKRFDADPRAYLNTFKYKLFCVTLKMACCCIAKKMYKINNPLIIDDVFDASDFENRVMIRSFAEKLSLQHNKLLPEPEYSLQMIFFTQDDLVAIQMEKGLKDGLGNNRVMGGRIFDYHEIDIATDKVDCILEASVDSEKRFPYYSVVDTYIQYDDKNNRR